MFHTIKVGDTVISPIDWEMTPDLSFGTYESWGGRERVRDNSERVYYFFVDNWGEKPKVCLMERAVKHARILAEIDVPADIVQRCVRKQGDVARFERSFAIDDGVKEWLIHHVLEGHEHQHVHEVVEQKVQEDMGPPLPARAQNGLVEQIVLPFENTDIDDTESEEIIHRWNFFEAQINPQGAFRSELVDAGDSLTAIDERTGLQWQSGGIDICSMRTMKKKIDALNAEGFAGFSDWRLPSLEEAMSLMEPERNFKGVHLHPSFSISQPFIFVSARRSPSGYWFVDYKQGRIFWSSGTIPGGFGRLCRSLN